MQINITYISDGVELVRKAKTQLNKQSYKTVLMNMMLKCMIKQKLEITKFWKDLKLNRLNKFKMRKHTLNKVNYVLRCKIY